MARPFVLTCHDRQLRIRQDAPRLSFYAPWGATVRSAIGLATDVEGRQLVLASTLD